MSATLKIYVDTGGSNGSPGTSTDTTALGPPNVRLKTADDPTIDLINPIPIPPSSTNYSFWKSLYVYCSVSPATQVNNLKIYTGGSDYGTGITTSVGNQFPTHNSGSSGGYVLAVGTTGTTGTELVAGYTGISSKTGLFTFTSGSPLSGPTISESGSVIDATGETSNYFVFQVGVGTTAASGVQTQATITVQWDEI